MLGIKSIWIHSIHGFSIASNENTLSATAYFNTACYNILIGLRVCKNIQNLGYTFPMQ